MRNGKKHCIQISPVQDHPDRYVASIASGLLGATFSVVFSETITGAVALHTFAEMIRNHYGHAVEIVLPDPFTLSLSPPVEDIIAALEKQHMAS